MAFDEFLTDAKLHIETNGRDESCANTQVMPYEPTPYCVLERLCDSGLITGDNHVIDYGSGKGRAAIYLSSIPEVMFNDEIDCTDLFPEEDDRNRIMIFDIGQDI